jgi:hypothetical protein
MATQYVNKPGGVVVHLEDGSAQTVGYGDPVPDNLASYVDPSGFSDSQKRKPDITEQQNLEASQRAALEGEQVNSSSSPVPGNYSDLDEDSAAQLVQNLASRPEQQVAILRHEQLFGGNRQKVIDAAGDYAREVVGAVIEAESENVTERKDYTGDPVVPLPDPDVGGIGRDDEANAEAAQEAASANLKSKARGPKRTPKPTSGSDAS